MRRVLAVLATASLCACATQGGMQTSVESTAVTPAPAAVLPAPAAAAVAAPVASPAAAAAAAIAAPSAGAPRDPVAELVDEMDQAAPAVSIPREPTLVLPPPPPGNLWERIRRGFAMPDLDTTLADNRTRWYAAQPESHLA